MKKCPYCAEEIQDEAIKCRYCGEFLSDEIARRGWWFPKRTFLFPSSGDFLRMIGFMLIFFGAFIIIAVLIFFLLSFIINWSGESFFKRQVDLAIFAQGLALLKK